MKRADEILEPAGVITDQFTGIEAIMGDIASTSSRDPDFGENLGTFFENEHLFDSIFGGGDRAKEPGSPASNDDEIVFVGGWIHRADEIANFAECNSRLDRIERGHGR